MLIRLILDPDDEHRSGANQMRQWFSFQEHSKRGNAEGSDNQDENPASQHWHNRGWVIVVQGVIFSRKRCRNNGIIPIAAGARQVTC
jgi:hypothetical protein